MVKEACKRLGNWCKKNPGPWLWLAAGAAALGLFLACRHSRAVMDGAARYFSVPVRRLVSALADPLPFSLAEALCTAFGAWLLFRAGRTLWGQLRGRRWLARRLVALAALAVWIAAGVSWLWGVHYYTTDVNEKSGLHAGAVSLDALAATTWYFAQGANRTGALVQRDADGRFSADTAALLAVGSHSLDALTGEYPFLDGPGRTPKPAVYSWFMSAAGFTGYIFPFTGESTLNVDCPNVFLPVTIAHEQAHQRGVGPEQEANFVAVAACADSGDPAYEYSGWLFGFQHLSNALWSADPARWEEVYGLLCEEARADLAANNAYWAAMEGPVQTVAETTYSGFLQSYGQELGMRSYGACVDLLVARWCPV